MRGEHLYLTAGGRWVWGSSPRARGALLRWLATRVPGGIIPACAGSTGVGLLPGDAEQDHPRVRGEHNRSDRERRTV